MVMRNLYLFLLILLPLFCISCYDDKGNYDYHALNQAEVAGIDSMYTAIFMEKLVITGGKRLNGDVFISGAKNAAVAIIPAAIMSGGV